MVCCSNTKSHRDPNFLVSSYVINCWNSLARYHIFHCNITVSTIIFFIIKPANSFPLQSQYTKFTNFIIQIDGQLTNKLWSTKLKKNLPNTLTHMDCIYCMYQVRGLLAHSTNTWRFDTLTNLRHTMVVFIQPIVLLDANNCRKEKKHEIQRL